MKVFELFIKLVDMRVGAFYFIKRACEIIHSLLRVVVDKMKCVWGGTIIHEHQREEYHQLIK